MAVMWADILNDEAVAVATALFDFNVFLFETILSNCYTEFVRGIKG